MKEEQNKMTHVLSYAERERSAQRMHTDLVDPTIAAFATAWDESLAAVGDSDARAALAALTIAGTLGSDALALRRSYMVADWFVREHVSTWLACDPEQRRFAEELRAAPPIVDRASARAALALLTSVRVKSCDAVAEWSAQQRTGRAAAWLGAERAVAEGGFGELWARAFALDVAAVAGDPTPTIVGLQANARTLVERMVSLS